MKSIRTEMPPVETDIPCPYKKHPKTWIKKQSLWDEYLAALAPGSSFLVEQREVQNLQHIGRQRQILLCIRRGPDERLRIPADKVRVWLAPSSPPQPEAKAQPEPKRCEEPPTESLDVSLL